tara:strand:- start:2352 stop:2492 length:141 start_codon:yes stop_codon:yes gene_type:complete
MTINRAQKSPYKQRAIADEKGDRKSLDILNQIDLYIEKMIKEFEEA